MDTPSRQLQAFIATAIRAWRRERYPGRGGLRKCAEAFSSFAERKIDPQRWLAWERGQDFPDDDCLEPLADFFGHSPNDLRRQSAHDVSTTTIPAKTGTPYDSLSIPELLLALQRDRVKAVYQVEVTVASVRFVPCADADTP